MSFTATPDELNRQFERSGYQGAILSLTIEDLVRQIMVQYVQWESQKTGMPAVMTVRRNFRYFIDFVIARRGENPDNSYDPQLDEQVQMFERVLRTL